MEGGKAAFSMENAKILNEPLIANKFIEGGITTQLVDIPSRSINKAVTIGEGAKIVEVEHRGFIPT